MLTMATSAVRDTVTRCTPGTVVGGVNAVVRLPGTSVGERQHTSLSSAHVGRARSWRCGAPNDGEDRKHGYLRERAGRQRSSKASWSGKKGRPPRAERRRASPAFSAAHLSDNKA